MSGDNLEPRWVSVVLPCLNEADAIGAVVDEAFRGIESCGLAGEVIVVDNGSTDGSADVARRHRAKVVFEPRRGYGSAYLAGLDAAVGDIVLMADADGTYDVSDLTEFVSRFREGYDLVLGSRFRGTIVRGAMPWMHRRVGNPLLTGILNLFFGIKVSDAHCGLRAVRRSALPKLSLITTGMEFASEMIVKATGADLRIAEIPIVYRRRVGVSKLRTFRDGWRHLRLLLLFSPTYLFFVPGATLLLLGSIVFIPLMFGPIHLFGREWGIHSMISGAAAILIGFQILFVGLFARTYAVLYLGEHEPRLQRLWSRLRLEHGLLLGVILFAAGIATMVAIFIDWAGDGFGDLQRGHEGLVGLTLLGLGAQTIFGSFFLSILGLRERAQERSRETEDITVRL